MFTFNSRHSLMIRWLTTIPAAPTSAPTTKASSTFNPLAVAKLRQWSVLAEIPAKEAKLPGGAPLDTAYLRGTARAQLRGAHKLRIRHYDQVESDSESSASSG